MGQSFTKESTEVSAKAINFLNSLKKDVEEDLRGNHYIYIIEFTIPIYNLQK